MTKGINTEELTKLTIEIPKEIHALIKSQAALLHTSIKDFIIDKVMKNINTKPALKESLVDIEKDYFEYKKGKNKKFKTFDNIEDLIKDVVK